MEYGTIVIIVSLVIAIIIGALIGVKNYIKYRKSERARKNKINQQEQCTHDWNGCKCFLCEKIREVSDEQHDWGALFCNRCGKPKPRVPCSENTHEWVSAKIPFGPGTIWGFRCIKCGKTKRPDIKV
jgi:hypothetical protein